MDLESGAARWAAVIILLCAFLVSVVAFRHGEGHGQDGWPGQTAADDNGQDRQPEVAAQNTQDLQQEQSTEKTTGGQQGQDTEKAQGSQQQDTEKVQAGQQEQEEIPSVEIGVSVQIGALQQEICLYQDETKLYAFVPSAAEGGMYWVYDEGRYELEMAAAGQGSKIRNGAAFSISVGEDGTEEIKIADKQDGWEYTYQICLLRSANLPAVFIHTQSGSMDWIHADKRNEEAGEFLCIDDKGVPAYAGGMEKLSGRGNSSWVEDKRSYSVTLSQEAALAGMSAAAKWVLQANALDATRMRNKLTYDMAQELGLQYAIDSAYVDVWLNGVYAGNYLLCEKIEAGENRVNISTEDTPSEDDGRYTRDEEGAWWEYETEYESRHGYLLEFNERIEEEQVGYLYAAQQQAEVKSPAGLTEEEYQYIREYVRNMTESTENAAQSDDWLEYIDLDSWSLLYVINELTNDTDANRYSVFYYKDKDTKMYAGPVWDYDIAWGNDALGKDVRCTFSRKGWYGTLYDNETFYDSLVEKYAERMKPVLETCLEEEIDRICGQIQDSIRMDDIRWAHSGSYTRRSPERDWRQAVSVLKDYMRQRMEFFDEVWLSGEKYHRIFFRDGDTAVAVTYIKDGDSIPETLLDYVAGCLAQNSWRTSEGETYDAAQPVYGDMDLYAQKLEE